ncbi:hypothetical protein [Pseudoflavonifractor sp. MCC625]|uniref:hypothetical protein n=1 Tax=Pseudoflavonifractor sp. MCC625 TaxID=2592647 RepID=UPI001C0280D1|nr:hypothetical protein [Pseudoflavonifractor sp. MCC625]MBT9685186.1 hypothetical protein [Pseudoflavonifractor sp. MCC625]
MIDAILGLLVVVAIAYAIVRNKKEKNRESKQEVSKAASVETSPVIKISSDTTSYEVDTMLAEGEDISFVDIGFKSESGGYVNWSVYSIAGKNPATNRPKTKRYEAKSKTCAVQMAEADGLKGPFDISVLPHQEENEKKKYFLDKLNEYGVVPPDGAVVDDLRDILNRVRWSSDIVSEKEGQDGVLYRKVRPIKGPSEGLAKYADAMGVHFSAYVSGDALFSQTVYILTGIEKAAFFAYCVLCSQRKHDIGDPRTSEYASKLYEFADAAVKDQAIYKSIVGRDTDDYLHPHKGSKAYKAVADFFGL